jgi:hypothetical protein
MLEVNVSSTAYDESDGSIRWAIKHSYKQPVKITFSVEEIDFSDVFYESGDQTAKNIRRIKIEEGCEGIEMIGPVTFKGVSFQFTRVDTPVVFQNIRIRVGSKGYGTGINTDCVYAEKCDDLTFNRCSFSYSNDEAISLDKCGDVDFNLCIFGPPLHVPTVDGEFIHKEGFKGSHGYLFRCSACKDIEIRRCLFVDASRRNPQINNEGIKEGERYNMLIRNCLIYNYDEGFTYNGKPDQEEDDSKITVNLENNLFIPGERTSLDSQEIDLEESKNKKSKFVLKGTETNRITHRDTFTVRDEDNVYTVESGEGPVNRYRYLLEKGYYGCYPNDSIDSSVTKRLLHAIDYRPSYDNLSEKDFYKRWPESGWISYI